MNSEALYGVKLLFEEDAFYPDILIYTKDNYVCPDIVIEVVSDDSRFTDLNNNMKKYPQMNIKEYWIVEPKAKNITVHDFINNHTEKFVMNETAQSFIKPELKIFVDNVYALNKKHIGCSIGGCVKKSL